jgi:hypothetical protein
MYGGGAVDLASAGFPADGRVVEGVCTFDPEKAVYVELGLQLSRTGESDGTAIGFRVDYTSHGFKSHMTIPFTVMLCRGPHLSDQRGKCG